MASVQINSYLDYIGAQFRINELRSYLFHSRYLNERGNPNDLEVAATQLRLLEENCTEYINGLLVGEVSLVTEIEEGEEHNG
jgi:hypothetical protein